MRTIYTIALFLSLVLSSQAQVDTSVLLISKVSFQPQFELSDGNLIKLMGYTKTLSAPILLPSPTLEFEEGDSVNLSFWNLSQGAPHTIHLHGLDVDQANDGVPNLSFDVSHDDTGSYYFKASHPGTYLYHCHVASVLHVQAGMYGMLIVRPKNSPNLTWENGYAFNSERAWLMSEVDTFWHADSLINHTWDAQNPMQYILPYKPQHFLVNGQSEAQLSAMPYSASVGEKVYLRLANIGYYGNRIIFPAGLNANVVSSDGRPLPSAAQSDTLEIYPGERYGVLLEANSEFTDDIEVEYVDLNTQSVANTQNVLVTIEGFLEVDEFKNDLLAYPNPATNVVNLPYSGSWTVVSITGNLVGELSSSSKVFDIRFLSAGTYLLKSNENNGVTTRLTVLK